MLPGAAAEVSPRPVVVEDEEYRPATTVAEAFLDCARYNDGDDAALLLSYLTAAPALIHARDEQGRTAVHLAAANGHVAILEMLKGFGPQPDVPNHEGNTALHFAALNNQLGAARLLLQWGWRATTRNMFEKTPIQLIYGKKFDAMETLLLENDEEMESYTREDLLNVVEGEINSQPEDEEAGVGTPACVGNAPPAPPCYCEEPHCEESSQSTDAKHSLPTHCEDLTRLVGSADVDGIE